MRIKDDGLPRKQRNSHLLSGTGRARLINGRFCPMEASLPSYHTGCHIIVTVPLSSLALCRRKSARSSPPLIASILDHDEQCSIKLLQ